MAGHYRKFPKGNRARFALYQRKLREQMGDKAYEEMLAQADNRGFVWFGIIFIVVAGRPLFLARVHRAMSAVPATPR